MNTLPFSTIILIFLSLAGLGSCLYFAAVQFLNKPQDSSEDQLSLQFFTGVTLLFSAFVWGMSAWSMSEDSKLVENSIEVVNQLPAAAAGIKSKPYMHSSPSDKNPLVSIDTIEPSANKAAPFSSLKEYEEVRLWLGKQLFNSGVLLGNTVDILTINLDEHPSREAIRTTLYTRPELLTLIYYAHNEEANLKLQNNLDKTPSKSPIIFFPKAFLGQIYYTSLQGNSAPIVASLVKSQIQSVKESFY